MASKDVSRDAFVSAPFDPVDDGDAPAGLTPEQWQELALDLAEAAPYPVVVFDGDTRVVLADSAFARLAGLADRRDVGGAELLDLVDVDAKVLTSGAGEPQWLRVVANGRTFRGRARQLQIGSEQLWVMLIEPESPLTWRATQRGDDGSPAAWYLSDRQEFAALIERNLSSVATRECGLMLVDVERFETISDALGMAESDGLFVALMERLQLAIGDQTAACRFAGDEIAVLTRASIDHERLAVMARSIIAALQEPFLVDEQPVTTRANVGATVGSEQSTVESMLREADAALSRARADGTGLAMFDDHLRAHLREMSRFEGELRLALAAGRMELFYQPEVDLKTGQAVGVEALVRWPHPVLGVVPADRFVEIAEVTGMAAELGRWVLAEACATLAEWIQTRDLTMKVNVSARQLANRELAEEVAAVLVNSGIKPGNLCLEITETSVMTDLDRSLVVLRQLTELGLQLAIDDFGTGFSSLAYLKDLPVDVLKIDRALVSDVAVDPAAKAILEGILTMAQSLGLEVVAEGVETEAQRRELLQLGCRRAQGHLFSSPLDRASAKAWLRA
ncbi:MAG: putative bifunctional diguanylate cyclase/phosphodiesterase [Acidimicrobiales bacterium]